MGVDERASIRGRERFQASRYRYLWLEIEVLWSWASVAGIAKRSNLEVLANPALSA
jgi:hypothetical protein